MRWLFFLTVFLFAHNVYPLSEAHIDVAWNEKESAAEYNLDKEYWVKLWVGSARGPVYRTLINCEKQKKGVHRRVWDKHDAEKMIDFSEYEKNMYFVLEAGKKKPKDPDLRVREHSLEEGKISFTFDVKGRAKRDGPFKVMIFFNNSLIKLAHADRLPFCVDVDSDFNSGRGGLLTFNIWAKDSAWVACRSRVLSGCGGLSSSLLYCRTGAAGFWQVFACGLDGKNERQLTFDSGDKSFPAVSADGKYLAYTKDNGELWVLNTQSSKCFPLKERQCFYHIAWKDDNKHILTASLDDVYHASSALWEIDVENGQAQMLLNRPWFQHDAVYSPDNNNVVFVDGPEIYGRDIYSFNRKTKDVAQLTENKSEVYDIEPAWFPDGKEIVYLTNQSGSYNLWVMDRYGQNSRALTSGDYYDASPCPAPDNRAVYFLSDRAGAVNIWRLDRDGSGLAQVTFDENDKKDLFLQSAGRL